MNNFAVFHYLLVALTFHLVRATRNDTLEVTSHLLTLRSASQVTTSPQDGCEDTTNYRQCGGELNGRSYTWAQENQDTNYVLFILSRRATISEVILTYSVDSTDEMPKVLFCAAPNDTRISNTFPNLTCQEVTIEATNRESRTRTISMPFPNVTNSIVMEVITQGIKAPFTATSVQFFGAYEVVETTSSPVTTISDTVISSDGQTVNVSNSTSESGPSPMKTSLSLRLLSLVSLLSLMFFY